MLCAALIDAGADPTVLDAVETHLPVRYTVDETVKHGIRATTVDVLVDADNVDVRGSDEHIHERDHHAQGHINTHDSHTHDGHSDDHTHGGHAHRAEGSGVHRSYPAVVELVESMGLAPEVESTALDAFRLLGRAEAAVHGTDLPETAFHEVGADDAIADIVGAALLLADLDVERIVTTPVAVGGGTVEMSHGVYPIPAPAVVEIGTQSSLAFVGGPVNRELLTPTGAAILGATADAVDTVPPMDVDDVGYGAGDATFDHHPNVLRALVGASVDPRGDAVGADGAAKASGDVQAAEATTGRGLLHDDIAVLETTLDDTAPEVLGGLQESLAAVGARDVTIVPTTMKKSRPGHVVTVICKPLDAAAVAERLARETGTLGVRQTGATHRWIAERRFETATVVVDGESHEVSVKVASTTDGDPYDVSAEYDDAAAVAAVTDLPVREVCRRAEGAVHDRLAGDNGE
jgi:uncharacterized protein (TIGR00299 family) protein